MAITVSGTTITFNDATTQSTTALPPSLDAIGSVLVAVINTTSLVLPGNTIAGSNAYYPNAAVYNVTTSGFGTVTPSGDNSSSWRGPEGGFSMDLGRSTKGNSGNTGFVLPQGYTALSGTWRVLWPSRPRLSLYDSGYNITTSYMYATLIQRIA
jgi:hypothetical protein